ncbi:MAG: sensor domain-containing diguanylate cyclase [Chloroflexi bacterium]|nr:sensor domain-containing diguanylate cyclase [Chloroflexota bacterium]
MRYLQYPELIFRLLSWATVILLIGSLLLVQFVSLPDASRQVLTALIILFGLFTFLLHRYILPRLWQRTWIFYLTTLAYYSAIAFAESIVYPIDLSALYGIIIVTVAVLADYRVALFAAALASALHFGVVLRAGDPVSVGVSGFYRVIVYFLTALLVSLLAQNLIERWRAVAAQAEVQRRDGARRQAELAGLAEIAKAFDTLDDRPTTFRQVTQRIAGLLDAEICFVARYDETHSRLSGLPPGYGLSDEQIRNFVIAVDARADTIWNVDERDFFLSNDLADLPEPFRALAQRVGARQVVAARMMRHRRPIGVIFAANHLQHAFGAKDARLLGVLAGQAATAVENAQLYHDAQTTLQHVTRLYAISTQLAAQSDADEIPARVIDALAQALNAPMATIALLNPATGALEYTATLGVPETARQTPFRPSGLGMSVARSGEARFVEDVELAENINPLSKAWGFRAVACLPIQHGGEMLGVLYVNYAEPHVFGEIEKNILRTFANQTAIALVNARLYRQLQEQARRDSLTQVYNHSYFLQRLSEEVERARQNQVSLALIMLDIDFFKEYNDTYGHVIGDRVLEMIVQAIRAHIHDTDLVGRWGGEEFGIALLKTDQAQARRVADRIRQTLVVASLGQKEGQAIPPPTISQGIAVFPTHAADEATLIDRADAALYRAKARGRDQVCVTGERE